MTKIFKFTEKQQEALKLFAGSAMFVLLFGGSRSGKTFLIIRNIVLRALKASGSRHVVFRFRFNSVKASVVMDTFPKVMKLCFPSVDYKLNKTDWYAEFGNGSQIWFAGLDDKDRTEKILGMEFVTVYLNESSQISYSSVNIVKTRLAQHVMQHIEGREDKPMPPKFYFDCNPPTKAHWTYRLFVQKRDPETKELLSNPENYASMMMNPDDNTENLAESYIDVLDSMSAAKQKRFKHGEFTDDNPNALFNDIDIEKWRCDNTDSLPDFVRIVVGVDPSGAGDSDNERGDAIGITVGALGVDGNAYLLDDVTVKASPAVWGRVSSDAYERHGADVLVGEVNYGGAMVKHVIKTANNRINYKQVTASRGKAVRAEPFSALYEQGKVRHVGRFPDLEDELCDFSTSGYIGEESPNRADSWIWVLTELFPALTRRKKIVNNAQLIPRLNHWS